MIVYVLCHVSICDRCMCAAAAGALARQCVRHRQRQCTATASLPAHRPGLLMWVSPTGTGSLSFEVPALRVRLVVNNCFRNFEKLIELKF